MAGVRDQHLMVEVFDGRLVISIGIDMLMIAATAMDDWPEDEIRITDPDAFAAAIARGLEREEEDGTTVVHVAIDQAVEWALEDGDGTQETGFDPSAEDEA